MSDAKNDQDKNARERILTAAESIFFSSGYDGVSVRELTDAAGVNVALVNYYFGGKRNLYLEVLRCKFTAVAEKKCTLLRQALADQNQPSLRQIITAYVSLYLDSDATVQTAQQFLRLISRQLAEDDDAMELLLQELILPLHQLTKETISKSCPELKNEQISLSISSITGQIFHFLRFPSAIKTILGLSTASELRAALASHIIEFSLKGIREETPCVISP